MDRDSTTTPASSAFLPQQFAGAVLALALVAAGLWILQEFLPALAWATVFAIALWPVNRRLLLLVPQRAGRVVAPALLTGAIGLIFIVPVILLGVAVARESHIVIAFISAARLGGIPVPDWVSQLPYAGEMATDWWRTNLSDPAMADALFGRIDTRLLADSARHYGREVVHRVTVFMFTLLALFFLFRDGGAIAEQLRRLSDRVIGVRGEQIARQMIAAVNGTVTGLVLVGLAEGVILGIVYRLVGLPYAASMGALTGIAAVVPFAAPVVYCLAGLYLIAGGDMVGGVVIIVAGSIVVFVADHFVRPVLIGGAARLPFLWVLLGILGGLQSLGFLGLFLGPAVMAALIALWREETAPTRNDARPPPRRPAAGRRRN